MEFTAEAIISLIGSLGFPIFMASWLVIKQDKTLEELTNAITALQKSIEILLKERDK